MNLYVDKYIKTKVKSYDGKVNKSFHDNDIHDEAADCVCLSVILIDCVIKMGINYSPQECVCSK